MRIVKTFTAVDGDGRHHTIHELQGEHDAGTMFPGPRASSDEMMELQTDHGQFVNYVGKGLYEVIQGTDTIRVTSDDPNAP